jgi:hypothetical protein
MKWRQLTTEKLLLAAASTGRISTTFNQRAQSPIGALHYHNLTRHHYDFIVRRVICVLLLI